MSNSNFSGAHIRNRAGIRLEIIQEQDSYHVYSGDCIIATFHTLDEAVSFARNYGTDSQHNG